MFFVGGSDRISHFSGAFWLSQSLVSGIIRQFQGGKNVVPIIQKFQALSSNHHIYFKRGSKFRPSDVLRCHVYGSPVVFRDLSGGLAYAF